MPEPMARAMGFLHATRLIIPLLRRVRRAQALPQVSGPRVHLRRAGASSEVPREIH